MVIIAPLLCFPLWTADSRKCTCVIYYGRRWKKHCDIGRNRKKRPQNIFPNSYLKSC